MYLNGVPAYVIHSRYPFNASSNRCWSRSFLNAPLDRAFSRSLENSLNSSDTHGQYCSNKLHWFDLLCICLYCSQRYARLRTCLINAENGRSHVPDPEHGSLLPSLQELLLLLQEPWDQRPLVSIACLVMSFHLLRSWAKLFSSCSPVLHNLTMSSIHSLHALPIYVAKQLEFPLNARTYTKTFKRQLKTSLSAGLWVEFIAAPVFATV